jgi:hypothetical protein
MAWLKLTRFASKRNAKMLLGIAVAAALGACHSGQTPEQLAAARNDSDNSTCRTYGLEFGSQGYAQCRMQIQAQRNAENMQRAERCAQAHTAAAGVPVSGYGDAMRGFAMTYSACN